MSDADVAIRPLRAEDAAQWRVLRLEALQAYPTAFASSYEDALHAGLGVAHPAARWPERPVRRVP